MRKIWMMLSILLAVALVTATWAVGAQHEPPPIPPPVPPPVPDWKAFIDYGVLIAGFVNAVAVVAVVQVLKGLVPYLRAEQPWLLPLIAMFIGPLIAWLQNYVDGLYPGLGIDLSPILGPFTGGTAVAVFMTRKKYQEAKRIREAKRARAYS